MQRHNLERLEMKKVNELTAEQRAELIAAIVDNIRSDDDVWDAVGTIVNKTVAEHGVDLDDYIDNSGYEIYVDAKRN